MPEKRVTEQVCPRVRPRPVAKATVKKRVCERVRMRTVAEKRVTERVCPRVRPPTVAKPTVKKREPSPKNGSRNGSAHGSGPHRRKSNSEKNGFANGSAGDPSPNNGSWNGSSHGSRPKPSQYPPPASTNASDKGSAFGFRARLLVFCRPSALGLPVSLLLRSVSAFGFRSSAFGLRLSVFGLRPSDFGFRFSAFGFRFSAFGFRSSAFGIRPSARLLMLMSSWPRIGFRLSVFVFGLRPLNPNPLQTLRIMSPSL